MSSGILVDTSVWIDHLRSGDAHLSDLLMRGQVLVHPHVIGEIALGSLRNRAGVVGLLYDLPYASSARDDEVLSLINISQLFGRGIGYTDAHLIASVLLSPGSRLWTRDKRLATVAHDLGCAYGAG